MTHLDLFTGIGGFALAAQWNGFRTVGFCEIEPYAQQVLKERFPGVPVHTDIFTLNGADYRGVTLVTGGFPCQPFSVAGKRRGKEDDRHLWPEMLRVIGEARPAWVLGENVPGIIQMELDRVLSDLESIGYACWPLVIPACAVDAKHRRERVWIVAYYDSGRRPQCHADKWPISITDQKRDVAHANSGGQQERTKLDGEKKQGASDRNPCWKHTDRRGNTVAHADQPRSQGRNGPELCERGGQRTAWSSGPFCSWPSESDWFTESGMGRVAHGIPARAHRLRGLGNAIVPQVAAEIIRLMVVAQSEVLP